MAKLPTLVADAFRDFDKFFVGYDFDRLAKMHDDLTKNIPNYPPYNIKKTGDNTYTIEMAVAGFSASDLEIEFQDDKLIVKGNSQDDDSDFLFRGIAARNFTRTFILEEHIEVSGANLVNGMLEVDLERIVPDHKKPQRIKIGEGSQRARQLLTE